MSIDQGTSISGWAILEDGVLQRQGVIDLHKEKNIDLRIKHMVEELRSLILSEHPDRIAFEDISAQESPRVVILLGRLQGCLIMLCWEYEIPFEIYLPISWRKVVGISSVKKSDEGKTIRKKRKELKQDACNLVLSKYSLAVSDDIADAILIGLCDHIKTEESKES